MSFIESVPRRAFPVLLSSCCLLAPGDRGCASVGEPLCALGACYPGPDDRQHSRLSRFDGTERAPAGPLRDRTVGLGLRRCANRFCRVVSVALAATDLSGEQVLLTIRGACCSTGRWRALHRQRQIVTGKGFGNARDSH